MRPKSEQFVNSLYCVDYGAGPVCSSVRSAYYLDWPTLGKSNALANGRWPDSGYAVQVRRWHYPQGWFTSADWRGYRTTRSGVVSAGGLSTPNGFDSPLDTSALDKLVSAVQIELLNKVKQSDVNVAVVLAEREELARTALAAFYGVAKSLKRFRSDLVKKVAMENLKRNSPAGYKRRKERHRRGDLQRKLNAQPISSLVERLGSRGTGMWLQWNYGIKPLLSDIQGAIDAASGERSTGLFRVRAHRSQSRPLPNPQKQQMSMGLYFTWIGGGNVTQEVGGTLWASLELPVLAVASSLGFTNPLELGWEMIPYSFLVDGVGYPIGAWLSSMDVGIAHTFHGGSHYVKATSEGTWTLGPMEPGGGNYKPEGRASCKSFNMTFQRIPYVSFPRPVPSFRPSMEGLLKTFASTMSLIVQSMNGNARS